MLAGLASILPACASGSTLTGVVDTGPVETIRIEKPAGGLSPVELSVAMEVGTFNLDGGGSWLVDGTIQTNVPAWTPAITRTANLLVIEQGQRKVFRRHPGNEIVNDWQLKLGQTPLDLNLNLRAYTGILDLSGLPLRNLDITDGASSSEIRFDSPNPVAMTRFDFRSGASTAVLRGLANANFTEMNFRNVGGDYTLEFSGERQRETTVNIISGLGALKIEVPADTAVTTVLDGNFQKLELQGEWQSEENVHSTAGTGHALTIKVEMDLGTLLLVSQ